MGCISTVSGDIAKYSTELKEQGSQLPEQAISRLWPSMCQAAGVPAEPMPPVDHVRSMWGFVTGALVYKSTTTLLNHMKMWPDQIYNELPSREQADTRGKEWMRGKL